MKYCDICLDYVTINQELMCERGFCDDCEAVHYEEDINSAYCPADFDIFCSACVRHQYLQEIVESVLQLNKDIDELCGHSWPHGDWGSL